MAINLIDSLLLVLLHLLPLASLSSEDDAVLVTEQGSRLNVETPCSCNFRGKSLPMPVVSLIF